MPLSWNEIKSRALKFSKEWEDAHYEKGGTHSFYNEFFDVFGISRRKVGFYEQSIKKPVDTSISHVVSVSRAYNVEMRHGLYSGEALYKPLFSIVLFYIRFSWDCKKVSTNRDSGQIHTEIRFSSVFPINSSHGIWSVVPTLLLAVNTG